jgi:uncharacterized lipoprotein YmbA
MTFLSKITFVAAVALLLGACGSSPPVRYYSLEQIDVVAKPDAADSKIVGLGPFRVPNYLRRAQIVTRGSGADVNINDFARWAEPLDQAVHGIVANNVDGLLADIIVVAYPYITTVDLDYVVVGRIDRFDVGADGDAVMIVQWGLVDASRDETQIAPQRHRYTARASNPDDPGSIATAMSDILTQLSHDIAKGLDNALR